MLLWSGPSLTEQRTFQQADVSDRPNRNILKTSACYGTVQVLEKCTELLLAVPEGFTEASYLECIAAQGGLGVPLNIFLMQVPYSPLVSPFGHLYPPEK